MTGILLLGVATLWIVVLVFVCRFAAGRLPLHRARVPAAIVLFFALVPLPLIDEIVGGRQFAQLCERASAINVDESKAKNRIVTLRQISDPVLPRYKTIPRRSIPGTLVPIREDSWDYVDVQSRETLVSFKTYEATGGWLIRTLGISEGNAPLTFSHYCAPKDRSTIFVDLDIRKVDEKSTNQGEAK